MTARNFTFDLQPLRRAYAAAYGEGRASIVLDLFARQEKIAQATYSFQLTRSG